MQVGADLRSQAPRRWGTWQADPRSRKWLQRKLLWSRSRRSPSKVISCSRATPCRAPVWPSFRRLGRMSKAFSGPSTCCALHTNRHICKLRHTAVESKRAAWLSAIFEAFGFVPMRHNGWVCAWRSRAVPVHDSAHRHLGSDPSERNESDVNSGPRDVRL